MIRYTKPPRFSREDRRQKLTFLQGRRKNAPGNPRDWDREGGIERGGFTLGGEASPALVEQISPRPVADALNSLERRQADINRGLEYLLQDLDI